ncbi:hypothetical protein B0H13DRAFT_1926877 [Mycena leptocephala]|nr:hypothetical protein B0H13DRAFT_1926877 [Mycena leptocephala]
MTPVNLDDDEDVQTATDALLGGDRRQSTAADDDYEEEEEEEQELDDNEGQNSDEEAEESEFELDFIIPIDGATDELRFLSVTNSDDFFQTVADEMDIRLRDLKIGYRFSTWKAKTLPRKLESGTHLQKLFENARKELDARKGSKSKTEFQVQIDNLAEKNIKGDKKPEKKGKAATTVGLAILLSLPSLTSTYQRTTKRDDFSDSDVADDGPQAEIWCRLSLCEKHSSFCLVTKDGEHIALSTAKLSLWSLLLSQGAHKSNTVAPEVLNLKMDGSKAVPAARRSHTVPEPAPYYPYYPPLPGAHLAGPYPPYYVPPPPAHAPTSAPPLAKQVPQASLRHDGDVPTLYPKIDDWLLELDTGERGEDGHNFSAFGARLRGEGYMRVFQLADEGDKGVDTLQRICPDMKLGTAKVLMKYARIDCKIIRRIECERKANWAYE